MRFKMIFIFAILTMLISCSKETPPVELPNPGFGIVARSINPNEKITNLPVLIKMDETLKGIQFTLTWDREIVKVGQPKLTESNSGFTVSTGKNSPGQMKVLVFSMTGDILDTSDPAFMTIPISVLDPQANEIELFFEKAVFAGPKAMSYDIPITHARLRIEQ